MASKLVTGLKAAMYRVLPQRSMTALVYWLTRREPPRPMLRQAIRLFSRAYGVNLLEAAQPDPGAYPSFNAFFTRALRPDARPWDRDPAQLCSPVDGNVSAAGDIDGDTVFQAKGRHYSLAALLGGDSKAAAIYAGGRFATLYLSPRDYHRVHMPQTGILRSMIHVPGALFSVSPAAVAGIDAVFARNERLVMHFDTDHGPMALIMVAAVNVAAMSTVWAGDVTPPYGGSIRRWTYPDNGAQAVRLDKGDELGRFNMGSTVILLLPGRDLHWADQLRAEAPVVLGRPIGTWA